MLTRLEKLCAGTDLERSLNFLDGQFGVGEVLHEPCRLDDDGPVRRELPFAADERQGLAGHIRVGSRWLCGRAPGSEQADGQTQESERHIP